MLDPAIEEVVEYLESPKRCATGRSRVTGTFERWLHGNSATDQVSVRIPGSFRSLCLLCFRGLDILRRFPAGYASLLSQLGSHDLPPWHYIIMLTVIRRMAITGESHARQNGVHALGNVVPHFVQLAPNNIKGKRWPGMSTTTSYVQSKHPWRMALQ